MIDKSLEVSEFQNNIFKIVSSIFPQEKIEQEYSISFNNKTLFIDIYLPKLKIAIECDGEQHGKFSKFFHRTIANFNLQKQNDELKARYCMANNICLVRVPYKGKHSVEEIKQTILTKLEGD